MNERIKQLEAECWDYARGIVNTQKFAELIVRECAKVADTAEPFQSNDLILKHFGVEE